MYIWFTCGIHLNEWKKKRQPRVLLFFVRILCSNNNNNNRSKLCSCKCDHSCYCYRCQMVEFVDAISQHTKESQKKTAEKNVCVCVPIFWKFFPPQLISSSFFLFAFHFAHTDTYKHQCINNNHTQWCIPGCYVMCNDWVLSSVVWFWSHSWCVCVFVSK